MRQLKITKSITNRESASLDKYLQEIGREELITVDEEVELAQRIRKGDRAALEKLTRANLLKSHSRPDFARNKSNQVELHQNVKAQQKDKADEHSRLSDPAVDAERRIEFMLHRRPDATKKGIKYNP